MEPKYIAEEVILHPTHPLTFGDWIHREGCCFTTAKASQMEGENMASFLPSEQPQLVEAELFFFGWMMCKLNWIIDLMYFNKMIQWWFSMLCP